MIRQFVLEAAVHNAKNSDGCGVCVVGGVGGPNKKDEGGVGGLWLVAIRGRDGAAAASREWFRTQEIIMMGNGLCASCASCVMMVMVMAVNCGGCDGVLLMMVM